MKALLLAVTLTNPILFVTQVPVPGDFTTVASTFGNHLASVERAEKLDGACAAPDEVAAHLDAMESWSAIVFGHLENRAAVS